MLETGALEESIHPKDTMSAGRHIAAPEVYATEAGDTFSLERVRLSVATDTATEKPVPVDRPLPVPPRLAESEGASLIQIWEGTVQEIVPDDDIMRARLQAKMGGVPDHFADIGLEWVSQQDRELVKPGAVFYLSLYRARRRGGTVVNSQELRFRRLPAWTKKDATSVEEIARHLLIKGALGQTAL